MPMQTWMSKISPDYNASGTALASSTTLTDISPAPNLVLPANYLREVSGLYVVASGRFSNTSTPTLLLGLYYGAVAGSALASTGAITTTTAASNHTWFFEALVEVRTDGSSGTAWTSGRVSGLSGTAFIGVNNMPLSSNAAVTIDTTAAKALTLGGQWGTNSASNTVICDQFDVFAVN